MKVTIWDLDNCLADDSRRIPLIDWNEPDLEKRYDAYHSELGKDPACNLDVFNKYTAGSDRVFFITARPEKYRLATNFWLCDKFSMTSNFVLLMRPARDTSSSIALKHRHATSLPDDYGTPLSCVAMAFDDKPGVVGMYRSLGIPAKVLAIHTNSGKTESDPVVVIDGRRSPSDYLTAAATLFEQRNEQYGNGYKRYGALLKALFPETGIPAMTSDADMLRLNLLMMCLAKLQRYATNFQKGGHLDSAKDLQVYAAMLEESTIAK